MTRETLVLFTLFIHLRTLRITSLECKSSALGPSNLSSDEKWGTVQVQRQTLEIRFLSFSSAQNLLYKSLRCEVSVLGPIICLQMGKGV